MVEDKAVKSVYLGGTISPAFEHNAWREKVKEWAFRRVYFNPQYPEIGSVRGEPFCLVIDPTDRNDMRNVSADGLHDCSMPDALFVDADIADIERCDVLMVVYWRGRAANLACPHCFISNRPSVLDSPCDAHMKRRQSIGTWGEMLLAYYLHKPIIVVTDDPDVAGHPFTLRCASAIESTIEGALKRLEVLVR